ncbi:MAG: hypothetical protein Q4G36_09460 [Paracoccus sp. (in: a-proteobacteria)]|nr:hypothetical protein [Paracoccus sp. (in: a-proteobacteria)]
MTQDNSAHDDHHDGGFAADFPALMGRRGLLALFGTGAVAGLTLSPAAALANCVALPWETAGPYPADGSNSRDGQIINVLTQNGVIRDDIRASFGDYSGEAEGVPLEIEVLLQNADGCTPLAGHAIYLWQCDALGQYSLYNLTDQNFLRGVVITDEEGRARLTSIVPGCYDGRWPHIHFEVFTNAEAAVSGEASVLTAQIALPHDEMERVYTADSRYANGLENLSRITLQSDNVFGDNTEEQIAQQMLAMTGSPEEGYQSTITIPVDFKADRSSARMAPPPGGRGPGGRPPRN